MSPAMLFLFFSLSSASYPFPSKHDQEALTRIIESATMFSLPLRYCAMGSFSDGDNRFEYHIGKCFFFNHGPIQLFIRDLMRYEGNWLTVLGYDRANCVSRGISLKQKASSCL